MSKRENLSIEKPTDNLKRIINSNIKKHQVFRKYNEIIIGGMGGSGIVGAIVADLYSNVSNIPLVFLRVQTLPGWANKNTLVIIISYSGNTSEMLSLYQDAKERGCGVVAVTSGGKLAKKVMDKQDDCILTKGGFMPRSDINTPLAYVLSIIDSQIGTDLYSEFIKSIKKIIPYAERLESSRDNYAREIALKLSAGTPFFYASESIQSVASRWRAQFNENSKKIASDGVFPEFDHNELEGWARDSSRSNIPVFIRTAADGETARYMDACADIIRKWGVHPFIIKIEGETLMESIMYGIILGDYVSLYVAELQCKDPSPVDAITEFKNVMRNQK